MDPVKARANYSRVCQLLIDKGGIALRSALHAVHPPSTLAAALNANKATLQKMRKRVIKDQQWDLLFPASGSPDSNNFDITLLTILLRNISGLPKPTTGWDVMPPPSDTSISADIARIKILRNQIYGHISRAEYDDTTFKKYWQDISGPLIKLGIPQKDVDELKVAPLSPEEESYIEKLKEWKEVEDELFSRLTDLEKEILNLGRAIESAHTSTPQLKKLAKFDFTPKINDLCKKFQDGTRQWFFVQLSSWLDDEESRVMILTAGPGFGKSVLFAKICEMYKEYRQLAACHFCDFKKSDYSNPHRILQSLASQMCDNVSGFREKLNEVLNREHSRKSLSDAFRVLLEDPLHGLIRTGPMLIVIDALDESKTEEKSEFLDMIADEFKNLPKWIKILMSSRPKLQVRKKLESLKPLEILPDDERHLEDLKYFIERSLQSVSEDVVLSLISKCEGSFLYAYYLVNELKQGGQGFDPINNDYICKGIAGFYHKQFTRLETGLQRFKPQRFQDNEWSSILKGFINAIAASKEPLPCKILFACMGLSSEEFKVRQIITDIMSEVLPIYDNCLTVYHKTLLDWLTLNGYEEHAFVADVKDGKCRLLRACQNVYRDIVSLRSISDFQISLEASYALKSGDEFLLDVGSGDDFHWLVNVRLNILKLQLGSELKFSRIFAFCRSKHLNHHYWSNIHLHTFSEICRELHNSCDNYILEILDWPYIYLQSLANGYFDFAQKAISGKNEARDILNEKDKVWLEEVGNDYIPERKIVSHAIMGDIHPYFETDLYALAVSPDNRLTAHKQKRKVEVLDLPSLSWVFSLEIEEFHKKSTFLQFSPDSLYLVWNSARSCISLTSQMEIPLIPHGPENVDCVSFSPCGMRLVTCETNLIKLWNVKSKDLLAKIKTDFDIEFSFFSHCNSYIFATIAHDFSQKLNLNSVAIFDSITLERLDNEKFNCTDCCLTKEDNYQVISPPPPAWRSLYSFNIAGLKIRHFHCPTGRIVLTSNEYCSNPFEWKDKKCVIFLNLRLSLVFCDFINQEVVDVLHIDCLPTRSPLRCVSKLEDTNFLVSLSNNQAFVISLEASTESCKRETRFFSASNITCYALSPDNSYIACCSVGLILAIINVDNGKTLQTVELKYRPEACWWSESYLWVICEGMVVKYPYNLAQAKLLGNEIEVGINLECVIDFIKGVLVTQSLDYAEICMRKICDEELYSQKIPGANFIACSASVSSDGCAVLLYSKASSHYQLWEIAGKHRWELRSSGVLDRNLMVAWFCLTGTKNFRTSIWLTYMSSSWLDNYDAHLRLSSIYFVRDEKTGTKTWVKKLPLEPIINQVIYVNSKTFILHKNKWIHFIRVETGEIFTSLYVGSLLDSQSVASFFLPSRGLLLFGGRSCIKIFRIRNVGKFLPYLIND